jgi:anti-sigma factor RsiW
MNCDLARADLEMYLDGELAPDRTRELEGHVRGCPDCAGEVLRSVQWKRAVRAAGSAHRPSAEFRERMTRRAAPTAPRVSWRWSWAMVGVSALLLAVMGLALVRRHQEQLIAEHLLSEVADLHVATLASSSPVDVVSSDRHTVKPWFQGKIPFAFNLPELGGSDFSLVGGRMAYLRQAPGAELIFQIRKHQISVFIFQEQALNDGLSLWNRSSHQLTFSVDTWAQGGLRYIVVGDATGEDIAALSGLLKAAG